MVKSKGLNPLPPGDPTFALNSLLNLGLTLGYGWVASVATATSRSWQLPGPAVNRNIFLTLLA
eukprot:2706504-Heterocapsa_arctica.AAC.1